ncbi:hypothetical protein EGU77_09320 [Pseudomonas syringae pv. theae]|nr:hypothetical protein [Pseudomonas syringae pv. theae]MBL3837905.1 hypothetical protein [Pseudomonas syringae pv. theae]MBL3866947.1 hypothetical protein [Pseudomonas syringae pv. theae]MBL3875516.1 hypothetical protein [Pseudomonas syringae pv. theae]
MTLAHARTNASAAINFSAPAQVHPGLEFHEDDGFVIKTAASYQGMVDIHDRRPLALSPELAREWTDSATDPAHTAEIARECCTPVDAFEWYKVGKAVGNVRNQGQDLIRPDSGTA